MPGSFSNAGSVSNPNDLSQTPPSPMALLGHVTIGSDVSSTIISKEHDAEFPEASVTVYEYVLVPIGKTLSLGKSEETTKSMIPQLSVIPVGSGGLYDVAELQLSASTT